MEDKDCRTLCQGAQLFVVVWMCRTISLLLRHLWQGNARLRRTGCVVLDSDRNERLTTQRIYG